MNHRLVVFAVLLLWGALQLGGCSRKRVQASSPAQTPVAQLDEETTGYASWYGHPYHGRRTSNGETYNMNKMTA
ncbi:MAG: hypothetical protein ACRD2L_24890, partial [Terriglobia bacterium]